CARNGALYLSDPYSPLVASYPNVTAEANADADPAKFTPAPNVSAAYSTTASGPFGLGAPPNDANGNPTGFVQVTVTWQFNSITQFPGIPNILLTRAVIMRICPRVPN